MKYDYDLIVIGAGSGGVRAARLAAQKGLKTAIAEEYRIGGTCVIRGCVPKKLMVHASERGGKIQKTSGTGWSQSTPEFNWEELRQSLKNEVSRLSSLYQKNLEKAGVVLIPERLVFKTGNQLQGQSSNRLFSAKRILIATGGTPFLPKLPGIEQTITTDQVFQMETWPKKIVIFGGGYIAVEFAGIFQGLGVETSLVYRGNKILRGFEEELRLYAQENLKSRGVTLYLNTDITRVEKKKSGFCIHLTRQKDQKRFSLETDEALTALGRVPNTQNLGLEKISLKVEEKSGAIKVDPYSQTNMENIYAVGDVTNRLNLTPVAIREAIAFIKTVYENTPTRFNHHTVPTAIFTTPPMGSVGLTESEARALYPDLQVYEARFKPLSNALGGTAAPVYMKVLTRGKEECLVGIHLAGESMDELIQFAGILLLAGLTKKDLDASCAVHPTLAEEFVTLSKRQVS